MKKRKLYILVLVIIFFFLLFFVKYEEGVEVGTWGMNRNINWK